jgi:hypothetical protein
MEGRRLAHARKGLPQISQITQSQKRKSPAGGKEHSVKSVESVTSFLNCA